MNEKKKTKWLKNSQQFKILSSHWRIIPDIYSMIDKLFWFFLCELTFLVNMTKKKKWKKLMKI